MPYYKHVNKVRFLKVYAYICTNLNERNMKYLYAKKPINDNIGELVNNTVHETLTLMSLQKDDNYSKMTIDINEDYRGVLWLKITVDGKQFVLENGLRDFIEKIKDLSI